MNSLIMAIVYLMTLASAAMLLLATAVAIAALFARDDKHAAYPDDRYGLPAFRSSVFALAAMLATVGAIIAVLAAGMRYAIFG